MKHLSLLLGGMALLASSASADAQYYEIANQIPGLISPALSGSFNYKGFIDVDYTQGMGHYKANVLEISTSQGFRYSNWFFMGVGIGADFLFSNIEGNYDYNYPSWGGDYNNDFDYDHSKTTKAVMIPLFTDFRFNIGGYEKTSAFFDLKVGCAFLCSDDYIQIQNGYLTNQQYFYLRPSLGVRIPVNSNNPKQAFNVGISYLLLTSNYWSSWNRNVCLSSLGANISFEW